jgi:hypothetical protein
MVACEGMRVSCPSVCRGRATEVLKEELAEMRRREKRGKVDMNYVRISSPPNHLNPPKARATGPVFC